MLYAVVLLHDDVPSGQTGCIYADGMFFKTGFMLLLHKKLWESRNITRNVMLSLYVAHDTMGNKIQ